MKKTLKIILICILFQSFQCSDNNESNEQIDPAILQTKREEIQNYINSFGCSETAGCDFIAYGSKPCGGPRTYLLFSKTVDREKLQKMVNEYNKMEENYNRQTGAISDCMFQLPPNEVKCINGVCTIVK